MTLVMLLLAALVNPAAARADTIYVDQQNPNCSATAPGTAAQPFCTIGAATARAVPGTTVTVSSGTYPEEVMPRSNSVTFTAAPGASVVVTGAPAGAPAKPAFYVNGLNTIFIRGFTITTGDKGVLVTGSSGIYIGDNRVIGCAGVGIQLANTTDATVMGNWVEYNSTGIYLTGTTKAMVMANAVAFNPTRGVSLYRSYANSVWSNTVHGSAQPIHSQYSTDNQISRNVIFGAPVSPGSPSGTDYAIDVQAGDSGPQPPTTGTQVMNNSIAQYEPAAAVNVEGSSKTSLRNNLIDVLSSDGGAAIRVTPDSLRGTSLDFDVVNAPAGKLIRWNSTSYASLAKFGAVTGEETRGIQGPPGFADPAVGNLTLTPGSPAIDSALVGPVTTGAGYLDVDDLDVYSDLPVDDPATPNAGAGTRGDVDRGAYEMRNLGFEASTDGWSASGSGGGVILTHVLGGHTGSGAALLTNTGAGPATCTLTNSPNLVRSTDAGTYTATLWVRADAPGAQLTLRLREWLYSAPYTKLGEAATTVTLSQEWRPVTVQYTPLEPTSAGIPGTTMGLSASVTGAPPGTCFYADDASVFVG